MCVRPPNDILFDDSFWDELAEAGINEVALQWLCLLDDRGSEEGNVYPQPEDGHLGAGGAAPGALQPIEPSVLKSPNTHAVFDVVSQVSLLPGSTIPSPQRRTSQSVRHPEAASGESSLVIESSGP